MSWRDLAAVGDEIRANRKGLRPLVTLRCRTAPSPVLAAVYYIKGERWLWTVGDKLSRAEVIAEGIDPESWPKVAESVRPLDRGWPIAGRQPVTCRKCRLSWLVDIADLDKRSADLPAITQSVLTKERFVRQT